MGLITTQNAGFGNPKPKVQQKADPKPVTGINYAGQPMKPSDFYNGRPEHMRPEPQPGKPKSRAPQTPEQLEKLRASAANARASRWLKRDKQKGESPPSLGN